MDTFDRIVAAGIADPDLDGPPRFPVRPPQAAGRVIPDRSGLP